MNEQPDTISLENRQAVLDEINALLAASGGIDEARAKKVRKAIDNLRGDPPAAGAEPGAEDHEAQDRELDARIDAGLEVLRERIHKQVERRNRDFDKALQLTGALEAALKANELQQAERAYQQVNSLMGSIPGLSEQRWKDIEKRLNRARPRLRKLESWRHWGTTQARQDLIEQIKGLPQAALPPEQLARRIKQAREQWQAWDKSGDNAGKELWQSFDAACEAAYQPCIAYFEKLRQQRADNLRRRHEVIDALNARYAATDWKQPDWRDIDRFVNRSRRDFYKLGNVDYKHRKSVSRALEAALGQFEQHLARERERSQKVRERLIADIEALQEIDRLHEALEQLEALKQQWTVTVAGKRNLENRLWKRFQTACDAIYRRRDAERSQHDAARNENLKQKQALIEELARAAATGDEELLAASATLARLQERWQAIGTVPRKQEKGLENRWRQTGKQFRAAVEAAQARVRSAEFDNLARRAVLCSGWEQAALAGAAADAGAARAEWDALPPLGGSAATAMEQRFSQAFAQPDAAALTANLATKQAACLKLEVLLELESPPECQSERMAYQIERLNASLHKDRDAQDAPEDLLQLLLTTGAVPAEAAGAIEQRTAACLARFRERA